MVVVEEVVSKGQTIHHVELVYDSLSNDMTRHDYYSIRSALPSSSTHFGVTSPLEILDATNVAPYTSTSATTTGAAAIGPSLIALGEIAAIFQSRRWIGNAGKNQGKEIENTREKVGNGPEDTLAASHRSIGGNVGHGVPPLMTGSTVQQCSTTPR